MHEVEVLAAHPATERFDRREILAEAGHSAGDDVARRPDRQHERQQQQQGEQHVDLAQPLDPILHPADDRRQRHASDADDQQHVGGVGRRRAPQVGEPSGHLWGTQAERRGQSEERGENGEDVDAVAEPPPHRLPHERIERRPERQRQAEVV